MFMRDSEGMSRKLQEAVQAVHAHQLAKRAWWRTCRLVTASLRNRNRYERTEILFKTKGSAPNSRRPCSMFTFMNWLNVVGTGPVVW
jgi:hypothetical protein